MHAYYNIKENPWQQLWQKLTHQHITLSTRLYRSGFTEIASLLHVPGLIQYSASTQSPLHGRKPKWPKKKLQ